MNEQVKQEKDLALETIITNAIQLPGVKVNRKEFLAEAFAHETIEIQDILELGPIAAGVPQERLSSLAGKLILKRTSFSSAASFVAGIPGGLAMAATIPADVMQFFGMALRLAQELSYLYGAGDLWQEGQINDEAVKKQLFVYCGAMFGVSGAVSGVRLISTQLAKTALKKIPQKALTKTFWYPMMKSIGKALSIKITKSTVAKGVSKAVPVLGGVISGGLNFASMLPMANRLQHALDSAAFNYSQEDFERDIIEVESITIEEETAVPENKLTKEKILEGGKKTVSNLSGVLSKAKSTLLPTKNEDAFETIKKLHELKESGIISEEEFESKKTELLTKI